MGNLVEKLVLSGWILWLSAAVYGSNATPGFTPEQSKMFKDISTDLRCPTCTGLSIYESDAEFSVQIKNAVKDQIEQGKSKEEIMAFFRERYGLWILREPPKEGFHILAWAIPIGMMLLGPLLIWLMVWRRRRDMPTFGVRSATEILDEFASDVARMKGSR